jgi:hypothetical protein
MKIRKVWFIKEREREEGGYKGGYAIVYLKSYPSLLTRRIQGRCGV